MRFNLFIFCLWLVASCGNGSDSNQTPRVGTLPVKAATSFSASSSSGVRDNTVIMLDEIYNQILEISIEPFKIEKKLQIPGAIDANSIMVGPGGDYFLAIGADHFAIVYRDKPAVVDPVNVFGAIASAAFDKKTNRLVVQDEYNDVGLVQLDDSGRVQRSWVGGSLLDEDAAITAGTLLPDGPLALSLSDGSIAVVDFEKSLRKQTWVAETFNPQWEDLDDAADEEDEDEGEVFSFEPQVVWMSPTGDHHSLIGRTEDHIFMLDTNKLKITEFVDAPNIISHFDQAVGHIITKEDDYGAYRLYWADQGTLKDRLVKIPVVDERLIEDVEYLSILNVESDALSLTYGPNGNYETVYRFKLSNSQIVSATKTPIRQMYDPYFGYAEEERKAELAIADKHLIYLHYNKLGKLERRGLGKNAKPVFIKGFNLENAQDEW